MCTREAVLSGWEALTQKDLNDIEQSNYDELVQDENGKNTYVYNEKTETTRVEAK